LLVPLRRWLLLQSSVLVAEPLGVAVCR
jgi:hypothetical protein